MPFWIIISLVQYDNRNEKKFHYEKKNLHLYYVEIKGPD